MSEVVGILIDLGNSETRISVVRNKVMHDMTFSNRYVTLEPKYSIPTEYRNPKSTILLYNGISYANGDIVAKEFATKAIKPVATQAKTVQLVTMVTMNLIFTKVFLYLGEVTGTPVNELDVTFDIRLMLPPSEHDKRSDEIKEKIMSIKQIDVLCPAKFTKAVNINSIVVLPEGATAYIGSVYKAINGSLQVIAENTPFITGDVLVIDIGAGTTDIVNIKDTELIIGSKETFPKGSNNVEAICKRKIYEQYEFFPTDSAMLKIFETGILEKGAEVIPVESYLTAAKESMGQELKNFLIEYLSRNNIEVRNLKGLLVVGGGALPTIRDGAVVSVSMADVLIKYIQELTPSVSLVSTANANPRYLNLEGLKLYYTFI